MPTYRTFRPPVFMSGEHSVADWMDWLHNNGVIVPTAPRPDASCEVCQGAVGERNDGAYWPRCYQCGGYSGWLDEFVPISYSVASGLESMLHRFKDFGHDWLAMPLGSLVFTFLASHRGCLEHAAGGVDVAIKVPSNTRTRTFNQLSTMFGAVAGEPVRNWFPWNDRALARDFSIARPARAELKPAAYVVDEGAVRGKSVLLMDDTWTSGSSMASSAAALKMAGATSVVGLTVGRQLNVEGHYGSTDAIIEDVTERRWTEDDCVLCV